MTGMDDLVTWLRAQLDEDERVAREAPGPNWREAVEREGTAAHWRGVRAYLVTLADDPVTPDDPAEILRAERIVDRLGSPAWATAHVARWDPARVLAEVDAKRRILAQCEHAWRRWQDQLDNNARAAEWGAYHFAVKLLALPIADRPGWREEWRA